MFNDNLATTLGTFDGKNFTSSGVTAFGQSKTPLFYTGKPHVSGLGYNFLFRNYRADLNKWQTADPIGYPDGLNSFAYVRNNTGLYDKLGLCLPQKKLLNARVTCSFKKSCMPIVSAVPSTAKEQTSSYFKATGSVKFTWKGKCTKCNNLMTYTRTDKVPEEVVKFVDGKASHYSEQISEAQKILTKRVMNHARLVSTLVPCMTGVCE